MKEEWRDVVGYEGFYRVSSEGRVRSLDRITTFVDGRKKHFPGKILSPIRNANGYVKVSLVVLGILKQKSVHNLVMESFAGNPPSGKQINHKNGDKMDNRLGNLEYVTGGENTRHAIDRLGVDHRGSKNGNSKLTKEGVTQIRQMIVGGQTQDEVAAIFGVDRSCISAIMRGRTWAWLK